MGRVAIVTDSAADLTPELARAAGITVVPLLVTFGAETFRAGVDLTTEQFWERMLAPDAPFPTTAASSPGAFREAFEACFGNGADAIVCIDVAETLSATIRSARLAAEMLPDREIHVVDSRSASMATGLLALVAAELAEQGVPAAEIARVVGERVADTDVYVVLDTLEYLRRGGRIGRAQAAVGTLLSVKPIISVRDGVVVAADRVRTKARARERLLALVASRPVERLAILYTGRPSPEIAAFRDEVVARIPGAVPPERVSVQPVGPSVGPHLGPGCLGAALLYAR